ncbi:MAG TPA: nucleotidyltransferase domain-containing protein [Patescibacteria group bacterium]|nr:nucleotidyltransferase domain-containing protein [Patescibacteria group bacterium]
MDKEKSPEERNEIPEMNLGVEKNYLNKKTLVPENIDKLQKNMDEVKKEIEKLKNFIIKKYPFTQAIGILPPQSLKEFVEEEIGENMQKEQMEKLLKKIHLYMIVPEEKLKEIPKIKKEIVEQIEKMKQNMWVHVKTPVDVFEMCLDSKFELVSAIAMSFPVYDKGFLGALRVAEIHKSLVLQKFEKYVVSYVIGGSLVRGEAQPTSDVDVFIVINDTDVKRMPRLELKERLRGIIYQYVSEANALAGVKNKLEPQVYLLTDFWESVKDAHPVIFTFIRDGIPIYDRGTFMPWKALLKMGKLKPSPEAIDMFMSMGDKTVSRAKAGLLDIFAHEIFWGVTTPSQALLMLYGLPPPTAKHGLVTDMKRIFVEKEKMLEKKYITFLQKVVDLWRDYEHEKIKEISGAELDKLITDTEDYLKRLKELREQIEKRMQEKVIEDVYKDVFALLKTVFGSKSQKELIEDFENKLVKKGKIAPNSLRILKDIVEAKAEFKKGKSNTHKVEEARRSASILINELVEYNQRCEINAKEDKK